MFRDCTKIKTAPTLSATTLENGCYGTMFNGCTNLESAPKLPATELKEICYYGMFENCTNLKTAPDLPAQKLANSCYKNMFKGCTNLTSVTMLAPSDQITGDRFTDWLTDAGTDESATSRTLNVKNQAAYNALKGGLPTEWKIGKCTVLAEDNSTITE